MLITVNSVVCHSKWLILSMMEKIVPQEFFALLLFWMSCIGNNFTQCCPRLTDTIVSSFLDAQHPPGTFHPPALTFSFESFSACTELPVLVLSLLQYTGGTYSPVPDTNVWHSVPSLESTVYDFPQQHDRVLWLNTFRFLSALLQFMLTKKKTFKFTYLEPHWYESSLFCLKSCLWEHANKLLRKQSYDEI